MTDYTPPPNTPVTWTKGDEDNLKRGVGLLGGLLAVAIIIMILQIVALVGMKKANDDWDARASHVAEANKMHQQQLDLIAQKLEQLHKDIINHP